VEQPPTWATALELADVGLITRLLRLNLLVTSLVDEIAGAEGIPTADYYVLGVLRLSPGHRSSPTRLCDLLGRSSGGMTLTMDRLEALGWLTREADPEDRRRVIVTLSPAGLELATRVNTALHAWEDALALDPLQWDETVAVADSLLALFEPVDVGVTE
jgi:DNA-binding MarR family transcriptional regulator